MSGGSVPGSGHHDTVPRTLDAGAFVIRKAAVQKYGGGALSRLANGVARFAVGGRVQAFGNGRPQGTDPDGKPIVPKKNREAVEALKMIDLGLQGMNEYTGWLQWNYGASVSLDMRSKTMESYGKQAQQDRRALEDFISRKTLTGNERQNLERIKQTWRQAMAQPLLWGKDLERELIDYMEQNQGEFYRRGGMAKSDTVPAMLTPGEFVVTKDAVSRYGAGFFEAINNLSAPAQALAGRALAGVQGFATGGLVQPSGSRLARPVLATDTGHSRTVRVELSSGDRKVNASVDARDESRLLQLLDAARTRAV
jgi:phage-related minor tail protein